MQTKTAVRDQSERKRTLFYTEPRKEIETALKERASGRRNISQRLSGTPQTNASSMFCFPHHNQFWGSFPASGLGAGGVCLVQKPEALHETQKTTQQLSARAGLLHRAVSTFQTQILDCRVVLRWERARVVAGREEARKEAHPYLVSVSLALNGHEGSRPGHTGDSHFNL